MYACSLDSSSPHYDASPQLYGSRRQYLLRRRRRTLDAPPYPYAALVNLLLQFDRRLLFSFSVGYYHQLTILFNNLFLMNTFNKIEFCTIHMNIISTIHLITIISKCLYEELRFFATFTDHIN